MTTASYPPIPPARSYLFAPGDHEKLLGKVLHAGADAVILDLEDAVRADHKEEARRLVAEVVQNHSGQSKPPIWVRINELSGEGFLADLDAVVGKGLLGVRVPKAESPEALLDLAQALDAAEERTGLKKGSIVVTCTVESALGLWQIEGLARSPRVVQLAFGEADFVADLGAAPGPQSTLFARSQMVLVSRVVGLLPPIAPVYTHLQDDAGFLRNCEEMRDVGFGGRSCIHPRQISTVHEAFTPDREAVEHAKAVVSAAAAAQGGGTMADAEFVDAAVVRRAQALIELASSFSEEKSG